MSPVQTFIEKEYKTNYREGYNTVYQTIQLNKMTCEFYKITVSLFSIWRINKLNILARFSKKLAFSLSLPPCKLHNFHAQFH